MKKPLASFRHFANNLFPHEVYFLEGAQNFQIAENKEIMQIMLHNLKNRQHPQEYPLHIDKRKYSNLKKWIEQKLKKADVDEQLRTISELETKVLLDEVDAVTEKELQKWLKLGTPQHHYFRKIYELLRHYEHFLLIRLREKTDQTVNAYLERYRDDYYYAEDVFQKLQSITTEIIGQYHYRSRELKEHEEFLRTVLFHPQLEGMSQYAAFIRLAFIYLNTGQEKPLQEIYAHVDEAFLNGRFYSPRILANYYANRLLMLSRFSSLNEAEQYGYLSLRFKNTDYLFYLTNLSAVLLRQGKSETALQLLRKAFPEMRQTSNRHTKLGFIAFYLKCMTDLGRAADAENFAEDYLKAYQKEVLGPRWHLFFVAYFRALMIEEKYGRILYLNRRFKIEARDKENQKRPSYLPSISWYIALARYVDEGGSEEKLLNEMKAALRQQGPKNQNKLIGLFKELNPIAPKVLKRIQSTLLGRELK